MLYLLECHSNWLAQVVHKVFSKYGPHEPLEQEQVDWNVRYNMRSVFKVGFLGEFGFLLSSHLNSFWLKKIQFFEMVILRPCLVILSPTIFFNQIEFRTSDQNKFLVRPNKTLNNNTWVLKNSKRNGSLIRLTVNEHKQENAYFLTFGPFQGRF